MPQQKEANLRQLQALLQCQDITAAVTTVLFRSMASAIIDLLIMVTDLIIGIIGNI